MNKNDNNVALGKIVTTVGLAGNVKVMLYSADPAWTHAYVSEMLRKVECVRYPYAGKANMCLCRIDGIGNIVDAKQFVEQEIFLPRGEMPALEDDEFYYHDLIGKPVRENGEEIDTVLFIHDFGSGVVLELRSGRYIHIEEVQTMDETGISLI